MEVDVSEPKSRSFNIFLRLFQLGLSLTITILICKLDTTGCDTSYHQLISIAAYALTAISLLALLYLRCRDAFPKLQFFILFIIALILAGIIIVVSIAGFGISNNCAPNHVMYEFTTLQTIVFVAMAFFVLFLPFFWIQRYSNSPGNIVWVVLFAVYGWSQSMKAKMYIICLLSAVICLLSLLANVVAALKGITTGVKKLIVVCWVGCFILMIVNEIIAIISYFQSSSSTSYADQIGTKLMQIFIAVNVIQILFWLFGLLTLQYENGDKVRDFLLSFGKNDEFEIDEEHWSREQPKRNDNGIGTIKY